MATLQAILSALDQVPTSVVSSEAPDFIVEVQSRTIGIEITTYQTGETVGAGHSRRQAEASWEALLETAMAHCASRPPLHRLNLGLGFCNNVVPSHSDFSAFIAEIEAFVASFYDDPDAMESMYLQHEFASPLMRRHLVTIHTSWSDHARWYSTLSGGFVGLPARSKLGDIISAKALKASNSYQSTDELWLIVEATFRPSEMIVTLGDAGGFNYVPGLTEIIHQSKFRRVFVRSPEGIWGWSHPGPWVEMRKDRLV